MDDDPKKVLDQLNGEEKKRLEANLFRGREDVMELLTKVDRSEDKPILSLTYHMGVIKGAIDDMTRIGNECGVDSLSIKRDIAQLVGICLDCEF